MRLISWNVNGVRAIIKKDFEATIQSIQPDILCLQETKASEEETLLALKGFTAYHKFANSSKARKGYSGTALLSKQEPIRISYDIGLEEFDQEGRVITAEYPLFFLITVYTPNSGEKLARLAYRKSWDNAFRDYLLWLKRRKPIIICGDFNVAHQAIDLARPKENYNRSAGYTQTEIDGFSNLLSIGLIDSYRYLYPERVQYSFWNLRFNARVKNVGWRIDHFLLGEPHLRVLKDAVVYDQCYGSDHCPVGLQLEDMDKVS